MGTAIWECKIGEVDRARLPHGADGPLRDAVERAYFDLTGEEAKFTFSGWGAELTELERAVAEDRPVLPRALHDPAPQCPGSSRAESRGSR